MATVTFELMTDADLRAAFEKLTDAERGVFLDLLGPEATEEIARRTGRSAFTISNHTRAIFRAFGVSKRAELMSLFVSVPAWAEA